LNDMERFIIINADDFGRNPQNIAAIISAFHNGIISSTSVLCTSPHFDKAITAVRSCPDLPVGVHLDFTFGKPVLPSKHIKTITDKRTGTFLELPELSHRIKAGAVDLIELRAEFSAQIDVLRASGINPTHLDNHRPEIYFQPDLFAVVISLAADHNLPLRYPISQDNAINLELARCSGTTVEDLTRLHQHYISTIPNRPFPRHPDGLFLMPKPQEGQDLRSIQNRIRNSPGSIFEICCHIDTDTRRCSDFDLLQSPHWKEFLRNEGITLASFARFQEAKHE
jgi:predicted glycoside hydrolase/deacetylase ChbG (UPF0249 family)